MKEHISDYMRIGLVHFMAYPDTIKGEGPVLQTINEIAKDDYFEIIEHTWIKDEKVREDARNIIKSAGLTNTFGGQPLLLTTNLNINDLDDGERQKAVCLLKEGIDEAYYMEASGFAYLSGKYANESIDKSYEALKKSTEELCEYAAKKGKMKIVLEVFEIGRASCRERL